MDIISLGLMCAGAYKLYNWLTEPVPDQAPEKKILLLGAVGTGKSCVANALLGETSFKVGKNKPILTRQKDFKNGYKITEPPGLFDINQQTKSLWPLIEKSQIIIFVTIRQLYREEIELIKKIRELQKMKNKNCQTILYINMQDIAVNSMTSTERLNEIKLISRQVSKLIKSELITSGSAAPFGHENKPEINRLKDIINHLITQEEENDKD